MRQADETDPDRCAQCVFVKEKEQLTTVTTTATAAATAAGTAATTTAAAAATTTKPCLGVPMWTGQVVYS